jgi:hypothetical protein
MGQGKDEVDASPAEIRKAIAEARSDLGARLGALNPLNLLGVGASPGGAEMSTTKPNASKGAKSSSKKSTARKSEPKKAVATLKGSGKAASAGSKSPKRGAKATRKDEGVVAKAGAALDTMAAGAVVGAVKAAAAAIDEDKVMSLKGGGKKAASTADVLGELAPDAAMGAVAGAMRTVLPAEEEEEEEKPKAKGAKKSKT